MDEPLNSHPADWELDAFVQRTAAAASLLELDRHLAACPLCRGRLQQRAGLDAASAWLRADLAAALPCEHLPEEAIQTAARGDVSAGAAEHLRGCAMCRAEVDDLKRFIDGQRSRRRPGRAWVWAAAAAALLVAASAVAWKVVQQQKQPELTASLRDAGGVVGLDHAGGLHAPVSWPPAYAAVVARAITGARLEPETRGLTQKPEFLLGESAKPVPFTLLHPVAEAVLVEQPAFSWSIAAGATAYRVTVYDENFRRIAFSPDLSSTTWACTELLTPGREYSWIVTARVGTRDVREPVPPAPEARFRVIAKDRMEQLREAARRYPNAHLLLAALYAQSGALTDARRELAALQAANPDSDLVRRLAASLGR